MSVPRDIAIRDYVYSLVDWMSAPDVLDLGCGRGYDLRQMASLSPNSKRLIGIDSAQPSIDQAIAGVESDHRLRFHAADVANGIPYADDTFDLVYSYNLLECIPNKYALLNEIDRVLRPGGQVVCAHYDWDSQLIDGAEKDLVRKLVHAFGDWKQAWMADCDAWMGRRLWRTFQSSGLFEGVVYAKTLTEKNFIEGAYGFEMIQSFRALVKRGIISDGEYGRFIEAIEGLASKDEYLYAITMFAYAGRSRKRT